MSIQDLMGELDERVIAQRIGLPVDEARLRYRLQSPTVKDIRELEQVMGQFMQFLFMKCVAQGAQLPNYAAVSRAKQTLENAYRRRRQTLQNAYSDAIDGLNGGVPKILDQLADGVKAEMLEQYVDDVFDRHVAPNSFPEKVEIIRQFLDAYGHLLSESVRNQPPEKYASNYKELLREVVESLKETGNLFRRI